MHSAAIVIPTVRLFTPAMEGPEAMDAASRLSYASLSAGKEVWGVRSATDEKNGYDQCRD
jgi:hypothetical protein